MPVTVQSGFSRNRLLSMMPADDFESLMPYLARVSLDARSSIEVPGELIRRVVFPEPSVVSVVAVLPANEQLEIALFGPEGMSGLAVLHGVDTSPLHTFVQVPGQGIEVPAAILRRVLDESPTLRPFLLRYAQAFSLQMAYTAVANGRFTLDERLARWLLMCYDRMDGPVLWLTHEYLASMQGVRRAGVTMALHGLEGLHVIRATRGRIEVIHREGLRSVAGASYGEPEREYERLMAPARGDPGAVGPGAVGDDATA